MRTIRIRHLPHDYDEEDIFTLCAEYGEIDDVFTERVNGERIAWVLFTTAWEAEHACSDLSGIEIEDEEIVADLVDANWSLSA